MPSADCPLNVKRVWTRVLRVTVRASWGTAAELAPRHYDLFADADGRHYVAYSSCPGDDVKRVRVVAGLAPAVAFRIVTRLKSVRVPAVPLGPAPEIFDGAEIELQAGDARFLWRSVPPEGWEELSKIVGDVLQATDEAIAAVDSGLPES